MQNQNNQNLNEAVYQYTLDQILSMKIKSGDKIPETKLAKEFGTSRTPIREALRRLADDGIINIYPNRMAEVATWDDETIRQIGLMRIQLDVLAARLAVYHGSNADFAQTFEHAKLCLEAGKAGNIAMRIREDCAFHCDLSRISKNAQLYKFSQNIALKIEFIQSCLGVGYLDSPVLQYEQHVEIYHALLDRNVKLATSLIVHYHSLFHNMQDYYPVEWLKSICEVN
mgnify:FL=1